MHDGVVTTLHSNTRWCSDGFEIHAWNGEVVRAAFAMDTCDREIMSWSASTAGVTGEMIRDMMLVAVESRFGAYRATNRVEWLTDNGSCYTAAETIDFRLSAWTDAMFHAGSQPRIKRHVRIVRQDV